ncbi:exodeoxyribonuclease VII large subunit [Sedimentibacter sp. zth1]|uniref:exodeoxyribonuclease VII large subunit n=1 Tax=Sedimentibacter sp. zth1 TaxID=2816908 RepID=UPI001A910D5C|nr:exodeoxyribonuclease VII large subunit [Sedimentibacter sp. zth1]QSX06815.1 exodeoxyribonuclease VII large subunit [Sedimentibacter sp. zth1]
MKIKPIKVSLLNQYVKKIIKSNSIFYNLYIEGEISNIRISKTGYTYFTLSDSESSVSCVCFYQDRTVIDGDKVIVNGELTVYEAKGTYQIVVKNIEKIGLGNIFKELEILKKRLEKQGLFEKNKEIPLLPSKIGVITSKSGAALQDILRTFNAVNGGFDVSIYNSLVQGDAAKRTIVEGISYFNNEKNVDVILLSRGGGSFKDLNVFNEVSIAEKIYMSKIPIVTGIGHDTDVTLADYVADVHCHTPTAAAEFVIRGYKNIGIQLEALYRQLVDKTNNELKQFEASINTYKFMLRSYNPDNCINRLINECDMLKNILETNMRIEFNNRNNELRLKYEKLISYDYRTQLNNGYSLVFDNQNNLINDKTMVENNQSINILFDKFSIEAKIIDIKEV